MRDVKTLLSAVVLCAVCASLGACQDKPKVELAPVASAALSAAPAAATATQFAVDSASSKVTFLLSPGDTSEPDPSDTFDGD